MVLCLAPDLVVFVPIGFLGFCVFILIRAPIACFMVLCVIGVVDWGWDRWCGSWRWYESRLQYADRNERYWAKRISLAGKPLALVEGVEQENLGKSTSHVYKDRSR